MVSGDRWCIRGLPAWRLDGENQLHHLIEGREGEAETVVGAGRRGDERGGRRGQPAFGDQISKAGMGGIFDHTAHGGGRRTTGEDRYPASIQRMPGQAHEALR